MELFNMISRRTILQTFGFGGLFSLIPVSLLLPKDDGIEYFEVDKEFPIEDLSETEQTCCQGNYQSKDYRYVLFPIECNFTVKYKNNPCYYVFSGWNILDKKDWDYIKQNDIRFRQEAKQLEYITEEEVRHALSTFNPSNDLELEIKNKKLRLFSIWIPSE